MRFFFVIMGWRVVFISEGEFLSLYLDNIKIEDSSKVKELIIPLKDIEILIIDNYKTVLSTRLMNKLTEYHINVVLCSIDHLPKSILLPISGHHQSPKILKNQIKWNDEYKRILHKYIVINKIHNQIELLKRFNKDSLVITRMTEFISEVTVGDSGNREGLAAKMYFRELFGKSFKRFNDDVMNAGLNYGYAILRSTISKSIVAKGLNPSLGIFHKGPNNHFNLSDDLIEVFRPLVDHYVYLNLMYEDSFNKEHRLGLIKLITGKILYNNKKQTVFNSINTYIDEVIKFFDTGEINNLDSVIKIEFTDL